MTRFPDDFDLSNDIDLAGDDWQERQEALREMFEQEARADQGLDPDVDPDEEGVAEDAVCGNAWGDEDCPLDGDAESAFQSIGWGSEDW